MRSLLFIVLVAFVFAPLTAQAKVIIPDLKTAQTAYKNKNYDLAFQHWEALKSYDEPKAYLGLGKLYARGLGVQKDEKKALLYFMKAAEQANKQAQYEIARAYEKGRGVNQDIDKAQQWYAISAAQGYQQAQESLSRLNSDYMPNTQPKEKIKSNTKITGSVRTQFVTENNLDLTDRDSNSNALITQGQIRATYTPLQDVRLHVQGRAVNTIGNASSNEDDFDETMDDNFVEMRQAWIEKKNLAGITPLSLKAGRQRFKEDRRNWWNNDLDAVRLSYNSTLSSGFLALGQNFSKYRVGTDNNLEKDEEERLRFFGQATHRYTKNHTAEFRFLYEHDHSNTPRIGNLIGTDDRDETDYNILWTGLRGHGALPASAFPNISKLRYVADIMTAIGTEDVASTTSASNPDLRQISAVQERDVFGWAFDSRLEASLNMPYDPTFILGYIYASGDNGSGSNSAFRQTGLESNTSFFPDGRVQSSLRQYGEVLRPELSNLHILNMGVNVPFFKNGDLNFHYYSYWRANDKTGLLSNGIDQRLSNKGNHIGQALDVSTNYNIDALLQKSLSNIKKANLRLKLGSFYSGDAYGTNENELAVRGTAEINIKF